MAPLETSFQSPRFWNIRSLLESTKKRVAFTGIFFPVVCLAWSFSEHTGWSLTTKTQCQTDIWGCPWSSMITADLELFWQEQESMCLCTALSIQGLNFGGFWAFTFQSLWFQADFGTGRCTSAMLALSAPSFLSFQAELGHFSYPDPLLSLHSWPEWNYISRMKVKHPSSPSLETLTQSRWWSMEKKRFDPFVSSNPWGVQEVWDIHRGTGKPNPWFLGEPHLVRTWAHKKKMFWF